MENKQSPEIINESMTSLLPTESTNCELYKKLDEIINHSWSDHYISDLWPLTKKLLSEIEKKNHQLESQKIAFDYAAIIAETDVHGKITYVNNKFIELSKYSRDELVGKDHRIINSGYHPKEFITNLWKTILSGDIWHGEIKNKAKDGTYYWVDTSIYPYEDENGKIFKFISIRFDITEKKRISEALHLANTAKTEFLANMSHEIRTPMNAIMGMANLLAETNLNVEQKKYIEIFKKAGTSLMEIINNILDLTRVEAGEIFLEKIPFEMNAIIKDIQDLNSLQFKTKGLVFFVNISPDLPNLFLGDPSHIRQIISNLIGNAIKFTEKGEVRLTITLNTLSKNPGNILFSVSDTGIGVASENLDKLFKPFSQADTSITRRFGGSGLGLLICKKLVEQMKGNIWVESELGKGTTFNFTLDLEILPNIASENKIVDHKTSDIKINLAQKKQLNILVVDDSDFNRILILEYLKNTGNIITEAENGKTAVEKAESEHFDIILMDIQMPILDGYSATKIIRQWEIDHNKPHSYIVAVTAYALPEEKKQSILAGCDLHLSKPILKEDLISILNNTIQSML
jgi:PAS domain S-box-containing protein